MHENNIVIGGWSLPPELLQKCFGPSFLYIDCNLLMPVLFKQNRDLDKNWPVFLKNHLSLSENKRCNLAGWSTGAIMAFALAAILPVVSLTLISPTLSFCRRDGFRAGVHPSVLRTMREQLLNDAQSVLSKFHHSSGLPDMPEPHYTIEQLTLGLTFLEQADCTAATVNIPNTHIFHGSDDTIIPLKAAELVAQRCGGTLHTLEGSHAVFCGNESLIAEHINKHTTKGNFS